MNIKKVFLVLNFFPSHHSTFSTQSSTNPLGSHLNRIAIQNFLRSFFFFLVEKGKKWWVGRQQVISYFSLSTMVMT
jgi:hypothetical protein